MEPQTTCNVTSRGRSARFFNTEPTVIVDYYHYLDEKLLSLTTRAIYAHKYRSASRNDTDQL